MNFHIIFGVLNIFKILIAYYPRSSVLYTFNFPKFSKTTALVVSSFIDFHFHKISRNSSKKIRHFWKKCKCCTDCRNKVNLKLFFSKKIKNFRNFLSASSSSFESIRVSSRLHNLAQRQQ